MPFVDIQAMVRPFGRVVVVLVVPLLGEARELFVGELEGVDVGPNALFRLEVDW